MGRLERVNVMRIVRSTLASIFEIRCDQHNHWRMDCKIFAFEKAKASHFLNLSRSGFFNRANGN